MKNKFTVLVILVSTLAVAFSAQAAEPPYKACASYLGAQFNGDLSGMRWEDVEAVGNSYTTYNSHFNSEFVKQHAGRIATLIRYDGTGYKIACSATLIDDNMLLTAAHCVTPPDHDDGQNVGVLFSHQHMGNSSTKRIDVDVVTRYVDLQELYDSNQYFPVTLLENGWDNGSAAVDYAIYTVGRGPKTSNWFVSWWLTKYAAWTDDLWHWSSSNNQYSSYTLVGTTDNTNGHRGWSRPRAQRLNSGDSIAVMGHPGGIPQVVSAGVFEEYDTGVAFAFSENRMLFTGADLWPGSSGSGVFDEYGNVVGVATWTTCAQSAGVGATQAEIWAAWFAMAGNVLNEIENIATPMWKICLVSDTIQEITNDYNCNGTNDYFDFHIFPPSDLSR